MINSLQEGKKLLLFELKRGEKATILDLSKVNEIVKRRLLDLGIMEGEDILLKDRLPFRGPFMLNHSGQCLGIRYQEAAQIEIKRA
jgi:ferrous iron transport protein A